MFLWTFLSAGERYSLIADITLDGLDASVKGDSILLKRDLFLDESVNLLLEEFAFVNIVDLKLLVVFVKVLDVLNDLPQDIVSGFGSMMFQGGALAPKKLHFFLVVIQTLNGFFWVSL